MCIMSNIALLMRVKIELNINQFITENFIFNSEVT